MSAPPPAVVLIPVKAFGAAKVRLSEALDPPTRAALARSMATHVVAASAPLPVHIVCEDGAVAAWAESVGASVEWTPGLGLNGAVAEAVRRLAERGTSRAVIAHGDLPFASGLPELADAETDEVVLVPDRRSVGTNVLSVPTGVGFEFAYGTDSFVLHRTECERLGLTLSVIRIEQLGWDIDEPGDLEVPAHLGSLGLGGPTVGAVEPGAST